MIATNRFFISGALGLAVGATGAIIVGYLAAIAIPAEFFIWFDELGLLGLARFIIAFLMQLLSFGILAALIGQVLGRTNHWLSNSLISYLSMISYIAIVDASNPFTITIESLTFGLVALLCLLASAYRSNNTYYKNLASTLDLSSAR